MKKEIWWQPAIILFSRLSVWIAIPVIVGGFLGKWLDEKYGSEPFLFLLCVSLAFLTSMGYLGKEIIKYRQQIKNDESQNHNNNDEKKL